MSDDTSISKQTIFRWYIIPALIHLLLVLVSGIIIRYQWVSPGVINLDTKFLIHAHSHLALLGWLFMVIAGQFLIRFSDFDKKTPITSRWFPFLLHISIFIMSYSFLMEGYSSKSIALSTWVILVITYWSIEFLRIHNVATDITSCAFLAKSTIVVLLISNIAPFALSLGVFMGEQWIRTWVSFYLHFQYSGWLTLAILAILIHKSSLNNFSGKNKWGIFLFLIGSVLLFETIIRNDSTLLVLQLIGFTGGLMVVVTTIYFTKSIYSDYKENQFILGWQRILIYAGLLGLILKAVIQLISSVPVIGILFTSNNFLVIGFTHLLLLGSYTPNLLANLRFTSAFQESSKYNFSNILGLFASYIFVIGCISMIGFLFYFGGHQLFKVITNLPVQKILMHSGGMVLVGYLLLFASLHSRNNS
jgi:hypothetical protein